MSAKHKRRKRKGRERRVEEYVPYIMASLIVLATTFLCVHGTKFKTSIMCFPSLLRANNSMKHFRLSNQVSSRSSATIRLRFRQFDAREL